MKPVFETIQLDYNSSIRALRFQCEAFQQDHGWHYHPEYELSYIVKGEGTRFVGDSIENYQSGDLVFLGPNTPHCWISNDLSADPAPADTPANEMIVIQFLPDCLGEGFLDIPETNTLKGILVESDRGVHYSGEDVSTIAHLMERIHSTTGLQRIALFIELLETLSKSRSKRFLSSQNHIVDNQGSHEERMEIILEYVSDNLPNKIKQTDAAKLIDMTPQSFSRFFKNATGRTFVSFVNLMRITQACQLLANSDMDILNISLACGYPNLSNFNRRFSELKNISPGAYRKKYQALSATASAK